MDQADLSVLLVIEAEIATTQLIERLLHAAGRFGIRYRKIYLESMRFQDLDRRTIPLFVRCGDSRLRLWIELLRRAHHPYLYYIDDNFWELRDDSAVGRYYRDPDVRQTLELAVSHAHGVLTNSEVLAAYLERLTSRPVVLPPFFDFSLIEGCNPEQTSEFRIGFAGSATRTDDLELIRPVIQPVLDRIPNAVFEFCGVLPREVEPTDRIRFFSHTESYKDFIRFQAQRNWAIGLAPLRDHSANRAKTNNKYREYGACGIAGIYSDMPPYQGSVIPGVTGLLVDSSAEAWLSAILLLAKRGGGKDQIARSAAKDVREKHCVEHVVGGWRDCIGETYSELAKSPSHLTRAYLSGVVLKDLHRRAGSLRLQVQDAYHKGGVRMVLLKSVERLVRSGQGAWFDRIRKGSSC